MRVLHVISGLGTGGAEMFLCTLARRLAARGFEQCVVSLTGGGAGEARLSESGIDTLLLNANRPWSAARSVRRIASFIDRFKPQCVQGWMYHGDLFATLATHLARHKPDRLLWNIRCSDMRVEDYALQLRFVIKACVKLSSVPDVVIANSNAGARVHVAAGYRPRRLEVIYNGVDTEKFAPDANVRAEVRSALGLGVDETVIMHISRVDPMKDHTTMLEAARELRNAKILLVGAGTERLPLANNVVALGPRPDVARLLSAGDIVVSSSAYGEGFSNAVAEGMSVGLVPVATDVGDARAIVDETGSIVTRRDPIALREALQRVTDMPVAQRVALGRAARQRIVSRFSIETAVEQYASIYT